MAAEEPDDRQGQHAEAAAFLLGGPHALPAFLVRLRDDQLAGTSVSGGAPDAGLLARRAELNVALRYATARETEALEFAEHAAALATRVANSEQRIAETLRRLGDRRHSERRHALADEAVKGASEANERGERLRVLADQAKDHLQKATVRALLSNAASAVAELGRAQWAVAEALDQLAEREEGEVAAAHRGAAREAATAADEAAKRATALHRREGAAL